MKIEAETESPEETRRIGRSLASLVSRGDLICLTGDLGAGKTNLVQGLAEGLGITEHITSPTFAIIKEYETGRLPLYHIDVYRLDGARDLEPLGYEDYFFGDGVTAIEWGDKVSELIPENALTIELKCSRACAGNENNRLITFTFKDIRWQGVVEAALR